MKKFYQSLTLFGKVVSVTADKAAFTLQTRSGDIYQIIAGTETWFTVLTNINRLDADRVARPESGPNDGSPAAKVAKYVMEGDSLTVVGIYQENGEARCLQARTVMLPHFKPKKWLFEETHWWIDQISLMADKWLDDLFDSTRSYSIDDFSKFYRTNLNIMGEDTDDTQQECATLSRMIYGLSSAYLLTGADRYYMAAKAGVAYQRESFRSLSHDGHYCFWAFGRKSGKEGSKLVLPSQNGDDFDTIPLYEQIYALAGMAQFYRITQDWEVLEDIRRTVNAFQDFYHDDERSIALKGFPGFGGYFSHLDYITMRPDSISLGDNRSRKNWNSVGDHIPAYLINLILSLDPIPKGGNNRKLSQFLDTCRDILWETSTLIIEKFPDPSSDYVNERFFADWAPDHKWKWQQNRGICGHNLKIAWNLTRVAFYYKGLARLRTGDETRKYNEHATKCIVLAKALGEKLADVGLDQQRGGIFDAVERNPPNKMPTEFSWMPTKDFWQQEQGILAFLILHGADPDNPRWLPLARECEMFWNVFFLDRDRQGIYFRTDENGNPIVQGSYANKGGHSVSCYHAFELNYLAHIYTRSFVVDDNHDDNNFCLYFKISPSQELDSINVLPDFLPTDRIEITNVNVNGVDMTDQLKPVVPGDFQIQISSQSSSEPREMAVQLSVR